MNRTTSSVDWRSLCISLIHAETEEEVRSLLEARGLWRNMEIWQSYGGMEMNRSIVGNQQSSPVAALVEKLVNSIDAILTRECLARSIDPKGPQAPKTMQDAVQEFFNVPEGRIQNLLPGERTDLAQAIQLVATGSKQAPNFVIIDEGEGQEPEMFPDTFLSLLRQNKTGIPFVQGKFNMGGTGVLQFAGRHSLQLTLSRRHPSLASSHGKTEDRRWGFTIIRRLDPGYGRPHSTYVYLAPDGAVPTFPGTPLPVRPASYPEPSGVDLHSGTVLKLWNYKVPGKLKTNLMFDMRRALEKHLPAPSLPIRLLERRQGYRAHSYETTLSGLSCVITDNPDDIEPGLDTGTPLGVTGVGEVQVRLSVVKEETIQGRNPKYPRGGVFFVVNGQLHSELDKGFIERRTKLDYIAGTTISTVDCSGLPERVREDLFLGSRDRMRECDERERLCGAISDYIKDHPGLKELNARRRQKRMASALSSEDTAKIIQDIVRSDPSLAALFGKGKQITVPRGPEMEKEPFVGKRFPTYFTLAKVPTGGLVKRCPRNRRTRVVFNTDAVNDYFSRLMEPGRIELEGAPSIASIHLWEGRASLTLELPDRCTPGDLLNVTVSVIDASRVEPFVSTFRIQVEPDAVPAPPGPPKPELGATFSGLPNIIEVRRDEWEAWGFNERSGLILKVGAGVEGEELDMAINLDNIYLRNERARRGNLDPEIVNYWFKYGMCLLAVGMLFEQRREESSLKEASEEDSMEHGQFDAIESASRGLAVTLIPVILQLGKGRIEAETLSVE